MCDKTIDVLLEMGLEIPPYQRPYRWSYRNISELLDDIWNAVEKHRK